MLLITINPPQLAAPHNMRTNKVVFHALAKLCDFDAKTELLLDSFLLTFFLLKRNVHMKLS